MPQVQAFAHIAHSADWMWQQVGSFQQIGEWHPLLETVHGEGEWRGAERRAKTRDGHHQIERLAMMDATRRMYRYEVTSSDMPVRDYIGEFTIREDQPHRSTVVWTAEFDVTSSAEPEVTQAVQDFFNAGVRSLEQHYSPGGGSAADGI